MPNVDPKRLYDGVSTLEGGMDAGTDSSLLQSNQASFLGNMTVRGSFASTRPPFRSRLLRFQDDLTESRFTGIFQGCCFYDSVDENDSSIIASIGGKLFRIWVAQGFLVTEITPLVLVTVTIQFTVPAANANVTVDVTSEVPFVVGDTYTIDSGSYQVVSLGSDQVVFKYLSGAVNATVALGTSIFDSGGNAVSIYETNPDTFDFVHLFQAENYIIVLCQQHKTIIFDGAQARQAGQDELPSGFIGCYAWGRIWMSLNDKKSFIAGDLVGSSSGTAINGYVDAILKVTENTFLNGGGAFRIPANSGTITAMIPLAAQDTSLGIGPVLVGCERCIVSVNAPVDRTQWQNLTYPIQSIPLLVYGPKGPRTFITVNSDTWFRSEDGIRSMIAARRDFLASQGNTPLSFEVSPILSEDTDALLFYESAVTFNNRILFTVNPYRTTTGNVVHNGISVVNLDTVSTMLTKSPSVWEGLWTGLTILQLVTGTYNGVQHGFMFSDNSGTIELWEILKSGTDYYDIYETSPNSVDTETRTRIQSWMETRTMNFGQIAQLLKLITGALFVDQIVDTVNITIKFRPDQYPTWITWTALTFCGGNVTQCEPPAECAMWQQADRQYAARVLLVSPPETCNTIQKTPVDRGYQFQFRLEVTGSCRIRMFEPHVIVQRDVMEGQCPTENQCETFTSCDLPWFTYSSRGT